MGMCIGDISFPGKPAGGCNMKITMVGSFIVQNSRRYIFPTGFLKLIILYEIVRDRLDARMFKLR
jgi:hypothetical protein